MTVAVEVVRKGLENREEERVRVTRYVDRDHSGDSVT